jgi:hypothetical protein
MPVATSVCDAMEDDVPAIEGPGEVRDASEVFHDEVTVLVEETNSK